MAPRMHWSADSQGHKPRLTRSKAEPINPGLLWGGEGALKTGWEANAFRNLKDLGSLSTARSRRRQHASWH